MSRNSPSVKKKGPPVNMGTKNPSLWLTINRLESLSTCHIAKTIEQHGTRLCWLCLVSTEECSLCLRGAYAVLTWHLRYAYAARRMLFPISNHMYRSSIKRESFPSRLVPHLVTCILNPKLPCITLVLPCPALPCPALSQTHTPPALPA